MPRLLKEKYKTRDGAERRAQFENGWARYEYKAGHKAEEYHYFVTEEDGYWRVQRSPVYQ